MDLTILANLSQNLSKQNQLGRIQNFDEFWSNSHRESAWRN